MLKLENVSKFYYSEESVTCALRKINLEFKIGEFVSIVGESGSGKTTLLNILSGLDFYQDGEMYYNGKPTLYFDEEDWEKYRKEEVAFIFQNYNLIDSYTVLENVMAAYLLEGYSKKEAKKKAIEKLDLVGLRKDLHKKSTKLSGGQKQRLAIARALAKETNIIVADEPTGNLDTKNGEQVLTLLKELSKDKLVIVVTHNQAEIEPYITRKVRLSDGEIVEDVKYEEVSSKEPIERFKTKENFKIGLNFALMNLKSQPKKCFFMFMIILVFTLSSFVFVSNFEANLDDNKTKILTDDIFINKDDTRLLVKPDNEQFVTDEILKSSMVDHVVSYEKYDYITDCNYYRPGDYKIKYSGGSTDEIENPSTFIDNSSLSLVNNNRFMRSTSHLTESDLKAGKLPENPFEMVVYGDKDLIGTKEVVLFKNDAKWSADGYIKYEVEIVGILKKPTEQAYFSEYLCKILDLSQHKIEISVNYVVKTYYREYNRTLSFIKVFVDPNLKNFDFSLPSEKIATLKTANRFQNPNVKISLNENITKGNYEFNLNTPHNISISGLGVSVELFDYLYEMVTNKTQFAVFIDDYASLDKARRNLNDVGLSSISCFNVSTAGYDTQKVIVRVSNLAISVVALIIIIIVIIAIGYAILRIKKNDFIILKMIGMSFKLQRLTNYFELLIYALIANAILPIFIYFISKFVDNKFVVDIMKYIEIRDYFVTLLLSIITVTLLQHYFDKFLKKKINITELKED